MNRERFRALIDGAVALWRFDGRLSFDAAANRCVIEGDGVTVAVEHFETGMGCLWRIETTARTARVHRSVVPALSTLRDILCPQRLRGRALFVALPDDTP